MTKNEEFGKDFDFEKEYGFDPNTLLDPEYESDEAMESSFDASFDEEFGKEFSSDFDAKFGKDFEERFAAEFGEEIAGKFTDAPAEEPVSDTPLYTEPAFDVPDFDASVIDQSAFEDTVLDEEPEIPMESDILIAPAAGDVPNTSSETPAEDEEAPAPPPRRRKPLSRERLIKEVYLPPIIAGVAALLCLVFIIGGATRWIKTAIDNHNDKVNADASAQNEKTRLEQEAEDLMAEAALLAAGYDYQGALDKLNSFSDASNMDKYTGMVEKRAEYAQLKDQVTGWSQPSSIANLSFQMLIVDTDRAFNDKELSTQYKNNFVTVDEFTKILQQIYDKGYVLVDFDSFVKEVTEEDGTITYESKPILLPSDKRPIMLTQTMVNYMNYMLSTDENDEDSEYGDGFASKLVVRNGEVTAEYMDAYGNTLYGAYDFVPILNDFIEEHPDFSYQGARAILAVTGEEGVFGYRTMQSVIDDKGQEYYNTEVEGAQEVIQALRDEGYTIASYSYGNESYGDGFSATDIQADMDLWAKEVTPVLGEVDTIVFAKGSDISTGGNYTGNKYNVLRDKGFRYFVGAAEVPYAEVNNDYVRQTRLMVTGQAMTNAASTFTSYFDAKSILDSARTPAATGATE